MQQQHIKGVQVDTCVVAKGNEVVRMKKSELRREYEAERLKQKE